MTHIKKQKEKKGKKNPFLLHNSPTFFEDSIPPFAISSFFPLSFFFIYFTFPYFSIENHPLIKNPTTKIIQTKEKKFLQIENSYKKCVCISKKDYCCY